MTNACDYSLMHHFTNARRLLKDKPRADAIDAALRADAPERAFEGKELEGNLCRCTGYHNIVKSIAAAAKAMS